MKELNNNIEKSWRLTNFCEIDKFASKAYCAIHDVDPELNLGDITQIDPDEIEDFSMMTWGFPCTDLSVAGKKEGFIDASGNVTRSGLYYEGLRILKAKAPALSIIENVKNLTGKRFQKEFTTVLSDLDEAGYNSYWQVLNAKDYGVPQNRERVFIVSIRKDIDNGKFKFPEAFPLQKRLKDILEDEVDESFYISPKRLKIIEKNLGNVFQNNFIIGSSQKNTFTGDDSIAPSLTSAMGNGGGQTPMIKDTNNIIQVAQMYPDSGNPQAGRIYEPDGISPAMDTCQGGNRMPKIVEPLCGASRGRYTKGGNRPGEETEQHLEIREDGCTNTLTTVQKDNYVINPQWKIRKLTPLECCRLMSFPDEAYYAARHAGISNSQLYKQYGNSIVVDCLYYILLELYKAMPELFDDLTLGSFFSGIGAFECSLNKLYAGLE